MFHVKRRRSQHGIDGLRDEDHANRRVLDRSCQSRSPENAAACGVRLNRDLRCPHSDIRERDHSLNSCHWFVLVGRTRTMLWRSERT